MLGFDRKAAQATWTAAAVMLLLALLYTVRSTLFVFVVALLFAYLLYPLVDLLNRVLPSRAHGLGLALAYVIFLGLIVTVGVQIGSRVADQAQALSGVLPNLLAKWEAPAATPPPNDLEAQIVEKVRAEVARRANELVQLVPAVGVKLMSVASDLVFVVIVPILAFFFLKDSEEIRTHILDLVDAGPWRARLDSLMAGAHLLLAHYMRALVLLSLATFAAYSIFFTAMQVPFGVLLAVIAMFLEFIPMIGPLSAGVVIVLVTAVSGGHTLVVVIFLVLYRLFQDYVLSPHLMGKGVELHPLLVLFGVFAGAEVAGVAGSFLSVPVLALARVLYMNLRRKRHPTSASAEMAGSGAR
jgi:predicted PurR-regulated permease PerM